VTARSESSYRRVGDLEAGWGGGRQVDPLRWATAAAVGVALFCLGWGLLHVGFYDDVAIVDTPVYQGYGERVLDGELPYRDFEVEYPPLALPVFVLPALGSAASYDELFQIVMLLCGCAAIVLVAFTLGALGASDARLYGATAAAALSPLLLGTVVLTRYDLWPAALLVGALAAYATARDRLGFGLLAAAAAAKVYPVVVLPLALLYVGKRRGWREARVGLLVFAAVLLVILLPFALVAPGGLWESLERQSGRPLQIESLGAGVLLAADRLGLYEATVVSTHGSQNLAGALPDALATVQTVLQLLAVAAVWALFASGRADRERLLAAAAASAVAFVAFGKVLSPQFLIWLLPLVPLVAAPAGVAAGALFAAALVLTQLWFPFRYWDVVAVEPVAWLVVPRDGFLVGLFAVLAAAIRREPERVRSA
jgi:hypothetical protein